MAINLRLPLLLLLLTILLYIPLQQVIQHTLSTNFSAEAVVTNENLSKFSLRELEIFLRGILEKTKSGEGISYESEANLKKIKALLAMYANANQKLVAKLIALINEILELNQELIYPEDGEHQTDHN